MAVNNYFEPIFPGSLNVRLHKIEKENNLKLVTCHGLRHTYYSLLLANNVPITTVSKYMGHSDTTIILKVYAHFIPDTQEKTINILKNIIN